MLVLDGAQLISNETVDILELTLCHEYELVQNVDTMLSQREYVML